MWLYRWLLRLYPAGFRAEYGSEMEAVFEEKRRAAPGALPIIGVWLEAVLDVIRHAVPLHLDALRQDLRAITFGAAIAVSVTVVLLGSLFPALRAAAVDPNVVIRDA